jgi:regulator of nucleoside diphosphate kinase
MTKNIWTTAADMARLRACIEELGSRVDRRDRPHLDELEQELDRAKIIKNPKKTPTDVITMRSVVALENLRTGGALSCALVYPEEGQAEANQISVLAPLGTAMLGQRLGRTFKVRLPKGTAEFRVLAIEHQPEAAGDFDR